MAMYDDQAKNFTKKPQPLDDFPDDLVKMIRNYNPESTDFFASEITGLKKAIDDIRESINTDKTWREEFKAGLKENNDQIKNLGIALEDITHKLGEEIDERKGLGGTLGNITSKLEDNVTKLKMQTSVIKGIGFVLSALFGGGVVSLIVMYLAGILKIGQQ
jgi:ATP-dependent 26S proteasome regulatory subunit